jgi:hypothetical protein
MCLFALMFFYSSPPSPTEAPQQQHAEKNEPKQNGREADNSIWKKARSDPVAFFTLWLVVFTAVLSGVGVIQLRLLTRAETVAEKSANAAKESADAARDAVSLSANTAERQLRAYVYAMPYRAFNIDKVGYPAQTYTIIGNKGSTFAHKVERSVGITLLRGPVPERFEDLGAMQREEGVFPLAPGAEGFVIRALHILSEDELAALMTPTGDLRLCAFGKITYEDAFGKRHGTTFCHVYFGPERLDRGNNQFGYEHWQAKFCDRHNEAD